MIAMVCGKDPECILKRAIMTMEPPYKEEKSVQKIFCSS